MVFFHPVMDENVYLFSYKKNTNTNNTVTSLSDESCDKNGEI